MTQSLCVWLMDLCPTTPVEFWGGVSVCRWTGHSTLCAQVKGRLEHHQQQEADSPTALGKVELKFEHVWLAVTLVTGTLWQNDISVKTSTSSS